MAQLANEIAVVMDREGHAQMSCIAGVGGDVKALVKLAQSGRPIMAIDGCRIACVKRTLARHDVAPRWHIELTELGIKKMDGASCSYGQSSLALTRVQQLLQTVQIDE